MSFAWVIADVWQMTLLVSLGDGKRGAEFDNKKNIAPPNYCRRQKVAFD